MSVYSNFSQDSSEAASSEQILQQLMQRVNISSQRALAEHAQVSRWQVQQLYQGNIETMRLGVLRNLAAALNCSLIELLAAFQPTTTEPDPLDNLTTTVCTHVSHPANSDQSDTIAELRQEYARLQARLTAQSQQLQHQFQAEALQYLESWLTYWPTAAKAATEQAGFAAPKLLPLVKPIERLIASWDVTPIGTVGEQLPYDPQKHQLAKGNVHPGELVRISHLGYRHRENLLLRAKVVPISPSVVK